MLVIFVSGLLLVGSLAVQCKAKGPAALTNEHLFIVGNDKHGNGKLFSASRLSKSVTAFSLDSHSVSSACGSHPSRCRELQVISTTVSNLTTKLTLFIPLENGVQLLELHHNGINDELSINSQHTLPFSGISGNGNCSSLGVQRISSSYYLVLCVNMESMYACELSFNTTSVTQSNIQGCQRILNVRTTGYMSLSNIVVSTDSSVSRRHLLFLLQDVLYRFFPVTNIISRVLDFSLICSLVNNLQQSPKFDDELLAYCTDHTSIVFNTDYGQVVNAGGLESVQYPCSQYAEFIIHLTQIQMDFSYKTVVNGSNIVKIFTSPTASNDFHSAICFTYGSHQLFTYLDARMGVFVFNTTSQNFTLLPRSLGCGSEDCELLLKFSNQYLVVRNREQKNVTVYDILEGRAIVTMKNATSQLVSVVSNLQALHIPVNESTTLPSKTTTTNSLPSFIDPSQGSTFLMEDTLATVVVLCIVITILIAAITVVLIAGLVIRKSRRSASFYPNNSEEAATPPKDISSPDEENAQQMQDSIQPGHIQAGGDREEITTERLEQKASESKELEAASHTDHTHMISCEPRRVSSGKENISSSSQV